ncbi:MAG: hypothetical protein A2Y23_12215, partial [Clostridiales bacterium GWB2_37_7]
MKDVFKEVILSYEDDILETQLDTLYDKMINRNYDFQSKIAEMIIHQKKKYRKVLMVENKSIEEITLRYLKKRVDRVFNVKYPDRAKIMRNCFALFQAIHKLSDFVIFRFDFKDFFQSVDSREIFDTYLRYSGLYRFEKDIFEDIIDLYDKCDPGIPTSNALTEIVARDFDMILKSNLGELGLIYYARYVDDGIMIFNRYVSEDKLTEIIRTSISQVFKKSKVKLNKDKTKYINKSSLQDYDFTFLGYSFRVENASGSTIFRYGISDDKVLKYRNRLLAIIRDYKKTNHIELFRQRLQLFFSRIVFYNNFNSKYSNQANWDVIGIVANYNELRHYINQGDKILNGTRQFMTDSLIDMIDAEL